MIVQDPAGQAAWPVPAPNGWGHVVHLFRLHRTPRGWARTTACGSPDPYGARTVAQAVPQPRDTVAAALAAPDTPGTSVCQACQAVFRDTDDAMGTPSMLSLLPEQEREETGT